MWWTRTSLQALNGPTAAEPQAVRQSVEQSIRRLSAIYDVHTGKVAFN